MAIFTDEVKDQLKQVLKQLKEQVNIVFFTQEIECPSCQTTHDFLQEVSDLSDKLNLTVYQFQSDKSIAERYAIDKIPAILILDKDQKDHGIRFFGMPAGYEINSFLNGLLAVSGKKEDLPDSLNQKIKAINKKVHIQVFVTLGCPYCPSAVETAQRLALENENIKADMVETSTFPYLAVKYSVQGVPKIVINEDHQLTGAQPIENFLETIDKLN